MNAFDKWCECSGVYLNDNDDAAKAARLMAMAAWDAAVAAERERCARLIERGIDLGGLSGDPVLQRYTLELIFACGALIREHNV